MLLFRRILKVTLGLLIALILAMSLLVPRPNYAILFFLALGVLAIVLARPVLARYEKPQTHTPIATQHRIDVPEVYTLLSSVFLYFAWDLYTSEGTKSFRLVGWIQDLFGYEVASVCLVIVGIACLFFAIKDYRTDGG
jgi:hypothetical protein